MRRALLKKTKVKPGRDIKVVQTPQAPRYAHLWAYLRKHPNARVCVVQELCGLGDQIMILPSLRQIKETFPNCHLALAYYRKGKGKSGDIYYQATQHCPWVDEHVDISKLSESAFDYVGWANKNIMDVEVKGYKGRIDWFRERLGIPHLNNPTPLYHETAEEAQWAAQVRAQYKGPVVALHVDSEEIRRSWPPEKYIALVELAAQEQPETTFWVFDFNQRVKNWQEHKNVVNYSNTTVRQMASLIKVANVYVGPDSGPMHVAAAVGTKSVIIFGPIPHQARVQHYPTHVPIQSLHLECCPCWYRTCPFDLKCMKDIRVDDIFNQYTRLL
jgi:ADP-heptose:LPS heptosyltransferase